MDFPPRARHLLEIAGDLRREANHDNVVIVAAGVAFYAVLALIPMLLLSISLYGLFTSPQRAERHVESLLEVLPASTADVLGNQVLAIADAPNARLSLGFVVSSLALLWTVSNATRALVKAVKIAYDQEDRKSILEGRFVAIGLTLAVIVGLVVALAIIAAVPVILARFDAGDPLLAFGNLRWILIGVGMAGGTAMLYRYAPPERPDGWRSVLPGVALATLMWTAASIGFSVYVSSFGSYNETYGTLGAAVVLLLWFWLTSLAIIVGAEFNEALIKRPYRAGVAESAFDA